jgi:hypothetical protein
MDFNSLLLIAIVWLLWTIHQDISESNDRQRSLKTALSKLANRFEQAIESKPKPRSTKKASSKTVTQPADKKPDENSDESSEH